MFLIPCRVLFEGGPHDGFFAEWEYIPEKQVVVPADPRWRDLLPGDGEDRPAGLAAIYDWRNTQIVGDPGNPEILLRYRFLTYHANLPTADDGRHRGGRSLGGGLWRRLTNWLSSADHVSSDDRRPPRAGSQNVRGYSASNRER